MYQDQVKIPIGDWANNRLKNLSDVDKIRDNSKNGSGFGKNISNWLNKETVYPTNVLLCRNGLLNFSQKRMILYWIHF